MTYSEHADNLITVLIDFKLHALYRCPAYWALILTTPDPILEALGVKEVPVVAGQPGDQIFLLVVTEADYTFIVVKLIRVVGYPAQGREDERHLGLRDLPRSERTQVLLCPQVNEDAW